MVIMRKRGLSEMKVSVIIPAYNCLEVLKHTLNSLERQDFDDFEVIVIDDGSSDGTGEYLRDYQGRLNLRPVFNEENLGRSATRNKGIETAKGELIVLLDADMEPADVNFLKIHWEAQAEGQQVTVGCWRYHPSLKKTGIMRYLEKRGASKFKEREKIPGRYFVSCNASAPREVLLVEGGFDGNIVHYGGEDLELGHRLSKQLPIRSMPSAIGLHRHGRKLNDHLRLTLEFGEHSLPFIISRHPELKDELSFDNCPPQTLRDIIIKAACIRPIFEMVKLLGKFAFMPPFVYNYLVFNSYRKGYLTYFKEKE